MKDRRIKSAIKNASESQVREALAYCVELCGLDHTDCEDGTGELAGPKFLAILRGEMSVDDALEGVRKMRRLRRRW